MIANRGWLTALSAADQPESPILDSEAKTLADGAEGAVPVAGQCFGEKFGELDGVDGFLCGGQFLGGPPAVGVDRAAFEVGEAGGVDVDVEGFAVGGDGSEEEPFFAVVGAAVEGENDSAAPHGADQVLFGQFDSGFLGEFAGGGGAEVFPGFDAAADGEPPGFVGAAR